MRVQADRNETQSRLRQWHWVASDTARHVLHMANQPQVLFAALAVGVLILRGIAKKSSRLNSPHLNYETGVVTIAGDTWALTIVWIAIHYSLQVIVTSLSRLCNSICILQKSSPHTCFWVGRVWKCKSGSYSQHMVSAKLQATIYTYFLLKTFRISATALLLPWHQFCINGSFWWLGWLNTDVICLQVILLVFFTMAGLCVGGFLVYHLVMIWSGVTTYESIKAKRVTLQRNKMSSYASQSGRPAACSSCWLQGALKLWVVEVLYPELLLTEKAKDTWVVVSLSLLINWIDESSL